MRSTSQVTTIMLDRGTEDCALVAEIHNITALCKIGAGREFIQRFPRLTELRQMLEEELSSDDGDAA